MSSDVTNCQCLKDDHSDIQCNDSEYTLTHSVRVGPLSSLSCQLSTTGLAKAVGVIGGTVLVKRLTAACHTG